MANDSSRHGASDDPGKITINLDLPPSVRTLQDDQLFQRDALNRFYGILRTVYAQVENHDGFPAPPIDDCRVYNSILIEGGRGTGKTAFLHNLGNRNPPKTVANEDFPNRNPPNEKNAKVDFPDIYDAFEFLPVLDPTLLEDGEKFLTLLIGHIAGHMEKRIDAIQNADGLSHDYYRILGELAEALHALFNKDKQTGLDAILDGRTSVKVECLVHQYLGISCKLLNKKCLVLRIDDIDMNFSKAYEILEVMRRFFATPFSLFIASGEYRLYESIVWKKLYDLLKINYENDDYKKNHFLMNHVTEITKKYFDKIFPRINRINMMEYAELFNLFGSNNVVVQMNGFNPTLKEISVFEEALNYRGTKLKKDFLNNFDNTRSFLNYIYYNRNVYYFTKLNHEHFLSKVEYKDFIYNMEYFSGAHNMIYDHNCSLIAKIENKSISKYIYKYKNDRIFPNLLIHYFMKEICDLNNRLVSPRESFSENNIVNKKLIKKLNEQEVLIFNLITHKFKLTDKSAYFMIASKFIHFVFSDLNRESIRDTMYNIPVFINDDYKSKASNLKSDEDSSLSSFNIDPEKFNFLSYNSNEINHDELNRNFGVHFLYNVISNFINNATQLNKIIPKGTFLFEDVDHYITRLYFILLNCIGYGISNNDNSDYQNVAHKEDFNFSNFKSNFNYYIKYIKSNINNPIVKWITSNNLFKRYYKILDNDDYDIINKNKLSFSTKYKPEKPSIKPLSGLNKSFSKFKVVNANLYPRNKLLIIKKMDEYNKNASHELFEHFKLNYTKTNRRGDFCTALIIYYNHDQQDFHALLKSSGYEQYAILLEEFMKKRKHADGDISLF